MKTTKDRLHQEDHVGPFEVEVVVVVVEDEVVVVVGERVIAKAAQQVASVTKSHPCRHIVLVEGVMVDEAEVEVVVVGEDEVGEGVVVVDGEEGAIPQTTMQCQSMLVVKRTNRLPKKKNSHPTTPPTGVVVHMDADEDVVGVEMITEKGVEEAITTRKVKLVVTIIKIRRTMAGKRMVTRNSQTNAEIRVRKQISTTTKSEKLDQGQNEVFFYTPKYYTTLFSIIAFR
jgi:hypothetical protein